jgi:hypothetical protein
LFAAAQAEKALDLFLQTSLANSPGDADQIFREAHKYLVSSLSWIPHKRPNIDLWETGVEKATLMNVLNHVALGPSRGEPLLAMYFGDT